MALDDHQRRRVINVGERGDEGSEPPSPSAEWNRTMKISIEGIT